MSRPIQIGDLIVLSSLYKSYYYYNFFIRFEITNTRIYPNMLIIDLSNDNDNVQLRLSATTNEIFGFNIPKNRFINNFFKESEMDRFKVKFLKQDNGEFAEDLLEGLGIDFCYEGQEYGDEDYNDVDEVLIPKKVKKI